MSIEATDIKKKYKGFELDIASLAIPKGFATALIGENGAGKSTLINIMTGIRLIIREASAILIEKERRGESKGAYRLHRTGKLFFAALDGRADGRGERHLFLRHLTVRVTWNCVRDLALMRAERKKCPVCPTETG